jgi:hypothetical protein
MWTRWVSLIVVLALAPSLARAEGEVAPRPRGFLTGLGLGLLVVGLGGVGLGVGGVAMSVDSARLLNGFTLPPKEEDVASYQRTEKRTRDAVPLMVAGFVTAGVGLVGAILCLVLDAPKAAVQVSVMPTLQGGVFSLDVRF